MHLHQLPAERHGQDVSLRGREEGFSKMFTLAPALDREDCGTAKAARG